MTRASQVRAKSQQYRRLHQRHSVHIISPDRKTLLPPNNCRVLQAYVPLFHKSYIKISKNVQWCMHWSSDHHTSTLVPHVLTASPSTEVPVSLTSLTQLCHPSHVYSFWSNSSLSDVSFCNKISLTDTFSCSCTSLIDFRSCSCATSVTSIFASVPPLVTSSPSAVVPSQSCSLPLQ